MREEFRTWLEQVGLGHHATVFDEHKIDFDVLRDLDAQDLKDIGLPLGDRKRLLKALAIALSELGTAEDQPSRKVSRGPRPDNDVGEDGEANRRQLTVMFCDLVDSTGLSSRFDPEDLYEIISAYQRACATIIETYGGYIARYMGDGILVYFGYPRADELAPERAVRAGLEVAKAISKLDTGYGIDLHVRVAIATGRVLVGEQVGEGESHEYSVLGETPNLAARLQQLAVPDSVIISQTTRELVGELFHFADLGMHEVKGLSDPVRAWRVDDELVIESRFEATHRGRTLTPLIGRAAELRSLSDLWDETRKGHGHAVLITGEAGIGKSRLALALRERIAADAHTLLRYFCVPYRNNSVLFPIVSQLERAAQFERDDSPDVRLDKLEALLSQSMHNVGTVAPLFADLLSIPATGRYPPLSLSPELQKHNTLVALEEQLYSLARKQPVVIIFEDLHWVDATTLELLANTVRRVSLAGILLIMTARPEFEWPPGDDELVSTINLSRFDKSFGRDLILGMTAGKRLPDEVLSLILEKTDGVPLFLEEFTKTVLHSESLVEKEGRYEITGDLPARTVPDTLQDSLMARLDHTANARKVAQMGAVIGRRFSMELLSRIADMKPQALHKALDELAALHLVQSQGAPAERQYIFSHALIEDAAYSSLLRRTRRSLHARVAAEIERAHPETASNEPELLAYHYTRAGDNRRAVAFWRQAGVNASNRAAHTTALRHFATALDLLRELPADAEHDNLELSLLIPQGVSLASTQGYATPNVQATYSRAEQLCHALGDAVEVFPVTRNICTFYIVRDELGQARELAQRCVAIAEQAQDPSYLVEAYTALGYVESHRGRYDEGCEWLGKCLDVYRRNRAQITSITPQDPGVACGALRAIVLWFLGSINEARKELDAALALAVELDHPFHLAYVHTYCAMLAELNGEAEVARDHSLVTVNLARDHGFAIWSAVGTIHLGYAKALLGEADEAVPMLEQVIAAYAQTGARSVMPYFLTGLAEGQRRAGRLDDALATVDRAIEHAQQFEHRMYDSLLYRLRGEITAALYEPHHEASVESFRRAIEIAQTTHARQLELEALLASRRFGAGLDDPPAVRDALTRVVAGFDAAVTTRALDEARGILARC